MYYYYYRGSGPLFSFIVFSLLFGPIADNGWREQCVRSSGWVRRCFIPAHLLNRYFFKTIPYGCYTHPREFYFAITVTYYSQINFLHGINLSRFDILRVIFYLFQYLLFKITSYQEKKQLRPWGLFFTTTFTIEKTLLTRM